MKMSPTGRLIDERPQIQNIPARTPEVAAVKEGYFRSLGYEAAGYGERRDWCAQFGDACLRGWDDYWAEKDPD